MATKSRLKNFTLNVRVDSFVTVDLKAETLKEALDKAEAMSTQEIWDAPGTKEDDYHKIIGIFES